MTRSKGVQDARLCAGPVILQRRRNVPYSCNPQTQDLVGRRGRQGCWHFYAHWAAHLDPQQGFVAFFAEVDRHTVARRVSWVVSVRQVDIKVCQVRRFQVCRYRGG